MPEIKLMTAEDAIQILKGLSLHFGSATNIGEALEIAIKKLGEGGEKEDE